MKSKNPITDAFVEALKARTTTKDYYTLCCELEQSHARLLAALKSLSNDVNGMVKSTNHRFRVVTMFKRHDEKS